MSEIKVKIDNVYKEYNGRNGKTIALNGMNLDIEENEFICIVGPSGCGKSTILNIIAGLLKPTSGYVLCNGKLVENTGTDRGVVFQQYALFPWLTVKKNIEFGLKLARIEDETKEPMTIEEWKGKELAKVKKKLEKDGLSGEELQKRIDLYFSSKPPRALRKYKKEEIEVITKKYLKMVQLEQFEHSYPKELSGGMKQRVALARAYAVNPEMLLLDEPFGALDAQTRTQLQSELIEMWEKEKKTCLFITHDIEEAIILASRVIIMSARPGRIKEIVEIKLQHPRNQKTKMSEEFLALKSYIWGQVYEEYMADRK